jgi:hypothetical protein
VRNRPGFGHPAVKRLQGRCNALLPRSGVGRLKTIQAIVAPVHR